MRPRNEEGGELVVVGEDKVSIPLKAFPYKVECHFKHKPEPPPCNPHHHPHHDELEWEIHRDYYSHSNFKLVIKWKVFDVREIFWTVYY